MLQRQIACELSLGVGHLFKSHNIMFQVTKFPGAGEAGGGGGYGGICPSHPKLTQTCSTWNNECIVEGQVRPGCPGGHLLQWLFSKCLLRNIIMAWFQIISSIHWHFDVLLKEASWCFKTTWASRRCGSFSTSPAVCCWDLNLHSEKKNFVRWTSSIHLIRDRWIAFISSAYTECHDTLSKGCAADSPTLSTPYLCPATWCVRGTQPFRWAWPLPRHFSMAGGPPEIRGARLTPISAGLGFNSRRPRDSINTWRWVVDICRIYRGRVEEREAKSLSSEEQKIIINKKEKRSKLRARIDLHNLHINLQAHKRCVCPGVPFRECRTIRTTAASARPRSGSQALGGGGGGGSGY